MSATLARLRPVRGLMFLAVIYGGMAVVGLAYLPWAIRGRDGAFAASQAWCRLVRGAAHLILGLKTEVRGSPPRGQVLVVGKHQSFLDIILIFGALPRGRFIMKNELVRAPVLGWYALRMGCIPVDRGKRGQAVRKMLAEVALGRLEPGQMIVYPQGTRVVPGVKAPYKTGTAALYQELGQPCVPVACNVGLFWPKGALALRPGRAVVEFLDPIPAGLASEDFMARLETAIERESDRLMAEAGFPGTAAN